MMTNIPVVKLGLIAVSRDCFPMALAIRLPSFTAAALDVLTEGSHLAIRETFSPASSAAKSSFICSRIRSRAFFSHLVPKRTVRSSQRPYSLT